MIISESSFSYLNTMEILPGVPLSLYLQGAWKGVDFPPGSSLHVFSLISAFSGTLGPLSTSLRSWETQPSPSEIIPPAKNSLHQHSRVGLSHGACLPQVSCPWSSCAGIKMGPWQFSCGSQQALHTSHGLCRLLGRPFCPHQGSGCMSASSAWLLICFGMRGPEGSKGPWG